MHAVIMGKKRVMVGTINMLLILLLLHFINHCSSSSSDDGDAFSKNDTISLPINIRETASHWPRRMLSGRRPAANTTTSHINEQMHMKDTNESPLDGSNASSSYDMSLSSDVPEGDSERSSSSTAHCANNGTAAIDPRYGVEKRLVPTGPNPLHN